MIDLKQFIQEWAILCDRFGRQPSDMVMRRYHQYLSERLDTASFLQAAKQCFIEEDFFPSPEKLIEKVCSDPQEEALAAWEKVLAASSNSAQGVALSPAGERALRSIGGLYAVGYADTHTQLPHLRRNFLEAYSSCHAAARKESAANLLSAGSNEPVSGIAVPIASIGKSITQSRHHENGSLGSAAEH